MWHAEVVIMLERVFLLPTARPWWYRWALGRHVPWDHRRVTEKWDHLESTKDTKRTTPPIFLRRTSLRLWLVAYDVYFPRFVCLPLPEHKNVMTNPYRHHCFPRKDLYPRRTPSSYPDDPSGKTFSNDLRYPMSVLSFYCLVRGEEIGWPMTLK